MGTVCADYDNDGDTDIYVANDDLPNFLFQNDGSGKFTEVGLEAGLAYDLDGSEQSSMGIACGDYDNNGWLDFYVTGYLQEWALLYKNLGHGLFEDVTRRSGAGTGTFAQVEWGTELVDFDNDGDRDLFVACGHFERGVERSDDSAGYQRPQHPADEHRRRQVRGCLGPLWGWFEDRLNCSRRRVRRPGRGRRHRRGRAELAGSADRAAQRLGQGNHWLQVRLRGTRTNRDAVGARVQVIAGDLTQVDEVHSGRGYQSHYGTRLHFGLGKRNKVDRILVRWVGGGTDVLENVAADELVSVTEKMRTQTGY